MKLNFQNNKKVTGKTLFYAKDQFCIPHSIFLNISFWQGSFVWTCCPFNPSTFEYKALIQLFFKKSFSFSENLFQVVSNENVQNLQ